MAEEEGYVLNWNIENFGYWNSDIHPDVMVSPESNVFSGLTLKLYPKGVSGQADNLEVGLDQGHSWATSDELFIIGCDGSLLFKSDNSDESLELITGPKFEEVISHIRSNEAVHKNCLTLRLRDKRRVGSTEFMCTKIETFDVFVSISHHLFELFEDFSAGASVISYPRDNGEMERFSLHGSKDKHDELSLTLRPDSFNGNVLVITRLTVLNSEDVESVIGENEHLFREKEIWTLWKSKTDERSLILHLKLIPNVKPRHSVSYSHGLLNCMMRVTTRDLLSRKSSDSSTKMKESLSVFVEDMTVLYQDQDFSDLELQCGDISIPAHKAILSARSPVFKAMLSSDMKEAASGRVDIRDVDPSTLARFLTFLYSGSIEDLQVESASNLYSVADMYEVPTLQRECASFLRANISISNVCVILSLADKHRDERLISLAHNFILRNFNEVLRSKEWKSFMKSEPLLAVETVTLVADKNHVSIRKGM